MSITIRKADKWNISVILNKYDYIDKIDDILRDQTKFQKVDRDTTALLKVDVNRLIEISNYANTSDSNYTITCR